MEKLEILSMLSPNSTPLQTTSPQTGMRLNSVDIAVCLQQLRPEHRASALAFALGDYSEIKFLERQVANVIIRDYPASWKTSRAIASIPKLVRLYIASLTPERKCFECKGKGIVYATDYHDEDADRMYQHTCKACGGKKKITMNQATMAKYFGVTPPSWHETWQPRFQQVGHVIDGWIQEAEQHLQRLLKN